MAAAVWSFLLANLPCVLQRSARRRLHDHDEISLVFIRDETLGNALKNKVGESESGNEQDQGDWLVAQKGAQGVDVSARDRTDDAIDLAEQPVLRDVRPAQQ